MKFQSQVYTGASGSIGGITYSRNRGGMYTRGRAIPINPSTPQQQAVRGFMASLVIDWSTTLTQADRDAWDNYAANVPITDALGAQIFLTGINMFVRSNVPRLQAGLAIVPSGPTSYDLGTFSPVTAACTQAGNDVAITFNAADAWVNVNSGGLLIYTSRNTSPSINFFKGPFRFAGLIEGNLLTPPTSPATITPLPFVPVTGNITFVKVRATQNDGRLSNETILRVTAT